MSKLIFILILASNLSAEWITEHGKSFHVRRDCISLRNSKAVNELSRAAAEKTHKLCGICSRWKTKEKGVAK